VLAHFAQPESKAFIARARELAAEPPEIRLFNGEEIRLDDFTDARTDKPA
jgi:quinol monooxygenase YgiN